MPVERFGSEYNMSHSRRGYALIFNHEHFDMANLKARAGTSADCDNLIETLQGLSFDVRVFKDLKYREILDHIKHCKYTYRHKAILISSSNTRVYICAHIKGKESRFAFVYGYIRALALYVHFRSFCARYCFCFHSI